MTQRAHLYYNNSVSQLLKPLIRTADANSTGVDLQGYNDCLLIFDVGDTGDTLSGSVYVELEVEESDDNSTFTDVANTDLTNYVTGNNTGTVAKIDDNAEDERTYIVGYRGTKRYVRGVLNYTGTHTNGIEIGVIAMRGLAHTQPQNT